MQIVIHGALARWPLILFNVASLEFVNVVVVGGDSETSRCLKLPPVPWSSEIQTGSERRLRLGLGPQFMHK
jgi:hypothetical protein